MNIIDKTELIYVDGKPELIITYDKKFHDEHVELYQDFKKSLDELWLAEQNKDKLNIKRLKKEVNEKENIMHEHYVNFHITKKPYEKGFISKYQEELGNVKIEKIHMINYI